MPPKTNAIHIRLDDDQKAALDRLVIHYRTMMHGEASQSSVIRTLIVNEFLRLQGRLQ
jgi:hypothetical protein